MNYRYIVSSLLALIAGLGFMSEANALWCWSQGAGATSNHFTPECPDSPGYNDGSNLWVAQGFIRDVCGSGSKGNTGGTPLIDVVVTYPDPAYFSGNKKFPLVVLQHGGALYNTFYDKHSNNTDPGSHHVSPYEDLAMTMASKGAVVITTAFAESSQAPYVASTHLAHAIGCFNRAVTTGQCGSAHAPQCFTPLMDMVAQKVTFVGHSSGAVMGLYLPEDYGAGITGLILIDPSKGEWINQVPQKLSRSKVPIVHMYPDFFGPASALSQNTLFRMGFPKTCSGGTDAGFGCRNNNDCDGGTCSNNTAPFDGPWIPLGIRELPTAYGGADPNQGHHQVHHCMGMSGRGSFEYGPASGHEAFCDNSVSSCTKTDKADCGGQQYCGPQRKCISNIKHSIGNVWGLSATDLQLSDNWILNRYVAAYSACFGADYGKYYQTWVNGMDRYYDDAGTGHSCTRNGYPDAACGVHTTYGDCTYDASGECVWAAAQDKYCVGGSNPNVPCEDGSLTCLDGGTCTGSGKVIRINNDEQVTEYKAPVSGDTRYYNSLSSYSAGTGAFREQTERLGTSAGATYAPKCGAMISFF